MNKKCVLPLLLALCMILSLSACSSESPAATADPTVVPADPTPEATPDNQEPSGKTPSSFLWDDFTDRDPNAKPDTAPNGASMW